MRDSSSSSSCKYLHIYLLWTFILFSIPAISADTDTLTATQSLGGANQTLISPQKVFEFGFFNTTTSKWYLGIWYWYKDFPTQTFIWVANRDTPLPNSNGTLKIGDEKNHLVLLNQTGNPIWSSSSNQTTASLTTPVLQLLDNGNLILKEAEEKNNSNYLWQSFDHPTDTLLPGMKLGWDLEPGVEIRVTSWKSQDDPSLGDGYFSLDYNGVPDIYLWNKQQRVFRRLAASDVDDSGSTDSSSKKSNAGRIAEITVAVIFLILGIIIFVLWKERKMKRMRKGNRSRNGNSHRGQKALLPDVMFSGNREHSGEGNMDDLKLPQFYFQAISDATNFFSSANKLGEGGFGTVYRGRLVDGQEIAVKRLSTTSGQGNEEFKNEVRSIAKLQHRNLVRLFGCCIEKDEKLLIYEFMENNSLDSIIFDKARSSRLDWPMRFNNIIGGIARGLLYLHHDSRFRIIHRDLKASNVLLDREMNPKISDFGIARIFDNDQTHSNTRRVVGTYGYMSPEYAMGGYFSVKSDVFSFGVLVLEIISGMKNRGFHLSDDLNLLGHAWRLWNEGKALELIDTSYADSYSESEVLRCIHVGLICVQEKIEDRPIMPTVVNMLNSETAIMPQPKHPGFVLGRNAGETDSTSVGRDGLHSINQVTVTIVGGR